MNTILPYVPIHDIRVRNFNENEGLLFQCHFIIVEESHATDLILCDLKHTRTVTERLPWAKHHNNRILLLLNIYF